MAYEAWYGDDDPDREPDLLALLDSIVNEEPCHICGSTRRKPSPIRVFCSAWHSWEGGANW